MAGFVCPQAYCSLPILEVETRDLSQAQCNAALVENQITMVLGKEPERGYTAIVCCVGELVKT